ncbi:MAG: DEAD/DEAH box helicase [Clostridiales bacterium]
MNKNAVIVRNRLSLRAPQEESLRILSELTDLLAMNKNCNLDNELEIVKTLYPLCTDFERTFPSICFSLATGVGKTRLMGAFIAYLFLEKKIRNFFVLAPNLTVYNKLIEDFSDTSSPKYVFQGIGEFVHNAPIIITGENYSKSFIEFMNSNEIRINLFNISKINSETRGGSQPRIKRLSEYLGDSYFNYLSGLDDLVLLMDESHHYRANRGMEVINELNPVLGLEVTATPQVESGSKTVKFRNVVYEYSLARAIADGFVKEPAVATRKNFDPSAYTLDELDRIKLEDGIRIHEDTKVALDIYARDNRKRLVKPFVLVVAKDTAHAGKLLELIKSPSFFEGYYADKVMEIHSNQSGEEKEENIQQLISLEDPKNKIEIVIHVNMLKEGWDVTNLYTIIPLRTAASTTLREQTIGRGLRLPYGKRTGDDKVDKLTIVAHDKFQEIVDEANKPDSIIKKQNIIEIDEDALSHPKEVIRSATSMENKISEELKQVEAIQDPQERQQGYHRIQAKQRIHELIPELSKEVNNLGELNREEIKQVALKKIQERLENSPAPDMFAHEIVAEAKKIYAECVEEYKINTIEIPRIVIQPSDGEKAQFRDFTLDVKNLTYQPVSDEILVRKLREQENDTSIITGRTGYIPDTPERLIVNELMNYSEIDYDSQSERLFALAGQAMDKFASYLDEDQLMNVVQYNKKEIGRFIYTQMMQHFYIERPEFEQPVISVKAYTKIEPHNYSKYTSDKVHIYTETIMPTSAIPTKVFSGFRKACHDLYKFDSKTEKDFAIILEKDQEVQKWMRPAPNQFRIYWKHNSAQYRPDFIVETCDTIYMIETKKEADIDTQEVQGKAAAALEYCNYATQFTTMHGGKPWKYILIPHNAVIANMTFDFLVNKYEYVEQEA